MKLIRIGIPVFYVSLLVGACWQPKEARRTPTSSADDVIFYAPVKGYAFKKSPAAFSVTRQHARKTLALPEPVLGDSIRTILLDTAVQTDELPPTYEDAPFFVVTSDSAFHSMVSQGAYKAAVLDSILTPVDFKKEFLVVMYAPPAALTEASASLSVNAVVPNEGVLYVSTSSYYSVPADSARQADPFWQVAMYKIERRNFSRVGIVAEDTTYFGL